MTLGLKDDIRDNYIDEGRDQCAKGKKGATTSTQLDSPGLPRLAHEAVVLSLGPFPGFETDEALVPWRLRGCLVT